MKIQNLVMSNIAQSYFNINKNNSKKSLEKLSTGHKVNRAADDAASLFISEKMRSQIRGLDRGTFNAEEGILWVQTGEGALAETTSILHRMKELTVYALNDTLTDDDRAMLQMEFDQLQSEIDKIALTTEFNTQWVFEEHESTFYSIKGNRYWSQDQIHIITTDNNTLTINYMETKDDPIETFTLVVPPGRYTTHELMDEIDDAMIELGGSAIGFNIEYTKEGTCNLNYEGGEDISGISGGLSYLFYHTYDSGSLGSLLGTTLFYDGFPLQITNGNNELQFTLVDFYGKNTDVKITINEGYYDREQIIGLLNNELNKLNLNNVLAKEYGEYSIQITSDDYFVTGLKGNMFKIDDSSIENVYTSVFYDNIKYGSVKDTSAYFRGGAVLTTNVNDTDHNRYVITDSNNTLRMKANDGNYVTITFNNGSYTATDIRNILNNAFAANSMYLNASVFTEGPYGNTFQGIQIESTVKGVTSNIDFDIGASSVYNTLFREVTYANLQTVSYVTGLYSYSPSTVTSGKSLEFPLEIKDGGDSFDLWISSSDKYTITLSKGAYNTMQELLDEIDEQINGINAPVGLKGKVKVGQTNDRIQLTPASNEVITYLRVSAVTGNTGYADLFVGTSISYTENYKSSSGTASNPPKITLDYPIGSTIDGSNDRFVVRVDGVDRVVTLPHGEITDSNLSDIVDSINAQLTGGTVEVEKEFDTGTKSGADRNRSASGTGTVTANVTFNSTVTGSGVPQQGSTQQGDLKPAVFTIPCDLKESTVIDGTNNQISCQINGTSVVVYLDHDTYTRDKLVEEIQKQFDIMAQGYDGVSVKLVGNRLCFTTKLSGQDSSLQFSNTSGTFITDLCSTKNPAVATLSNVALNNSIEINGTNNEFKFKLNGNDITVNLSTNTYDKDTFIKELNDYFIANGLGVSANLYNSNYLRLTTTDVGTGANVSIDTSTVGSCAQAVFGDLLEPATVTIPLALQPSIEIDSSSNEFECTINNEVVKITLNNKSNYTPQELADELSNKLASKGVVVTLDASGRLNFATTKEGTGANIRITSGSSSMKKIFGTNPVTTSGVTAATTTNANRDKQLVLTGSEVGTSRSLRVSSEGSAGNRLFLPRKELTNSISPTFVNGSLSSRKAYINGVNLQEPVNITALNKQLSFTFGGNQSVNITLDEKAYTFEELRDTLQNKIDAIIGANKIAVTVNSAGVRLEATVAVNSTYNMTSFSGGFYKYVISGSTISKTNKEVINIDGTQILNPAYAIGRQDVRNNSVQIIAGSNDELSLDLTIGGTLYKVNMKLDSGTYQGDSLSSHIQTKLNEALTKLGLPPNLVKATIGGFDSGVVGSNDNNSLTFSISTDYVLDTEGQYIIDGVSGSASFYVFYKTDGSPIPTYIQGAKDISDGVTITSDNDTFSFVANDIKYEYTIPEGEYTAEKLVEVLNDCISAGPTSPPIVAIYADDNLKLSFTKFGDNTLHSVSGLAKGDLFYQEESRIDGETGIKLQLSGTSGDSLTIKKPRVTTMALGINSIVISKTKYADKALERIDTALNTILSNRTYYGVGQNRLEHVKSVNNTASENTQMSESIIRDTDIAKEMVELAKSNILLQTSQVMLTQANISAERVLNLLRK